MCYPYGIGKLEVTVKQYVAFLNTVDPTGRDRHNLFSANESSAAWPKYGQINSEGRSAGPAATTRIAYPEWADKPYGFANFLAVGSLRELPHQRQASSRSGPSMPLGFTYVIYEVRLSRNTERGMYDMRSGQDDAQRSATGFVVPSQDEWIKAAYFDPNGGGMYSYWKYPTNPGTFFDQPTQLSPDPSAPNTATLNPTTGDVTNSATQPLAIYHGTSFPTWCPSQVSANTCNTVNPLHLSASSLPEGLPGQPRHRGPGEDVRPVGHARPGRQRGRVDRHDHAPAGGQEGRRVWRRLHGGVPNAPGYQLWLSAIGLQPQDNKFYNAIYPWLGFRIGVIGDPGSGSARAGR